MTESEKMNAWLLYDFPDPEVTRESEDSVGPTEAEGGTK